MESPAGYAAFFIFSQNTSFGYISSRVLGYDMAARVLGFAAPLDSMRELVQLRFGRECALTWMAMMKTEFTEPDRDAKDTVFQFYDDLVAIRADRGLEYLHAEYNCMAQLKRKRTPNPKWPAPV